MNVVIIVNSLSISEERLVVVTWCILKNIWHIHNPKIIWWHTTIYKKKKKRIPTSCRVLFTWKLITRAEHRFIWKLWHSPNPVLGTWWTFRCWRRSHITPSIKQKVCCLCDNLVLTNLLYTHIIKQVPGKIDRIFAVCCVVPSCHSSCVVTHSIQVIKVFIRATDWTSTLTSPCAPP